MSQRKRFSLTRATQVNRRHPVEVQPPAVADTRNLFTSRSDEALTVRSDLQYVANIDPPAWSDDWTVPTGEDGADYVSSVYYSGKAERSVYFTRYLPMMLDRAANENLVDTYTTGTLTATSGSSFVEGDGTEWLQNVPAGCWLGVGSDVYLIDEIIDDGALYIRGEAGSWSGTSYTIYLTYHADYARWPLQIDSFGANVVVNSVQPTGRIPGKKLNGPYYSQLNSEVPDSWSVATVNCSNAFNVNSLVQSPDGNKSLLCCDGGLIFRQVHGRNTTW